MTNKAVFFLLVLLSFLSCYQEKSGIDDEKMFEFRDRWLVLGKIADQSLKNANIVAIGIDGTKYKTKTDDEASFALELPGNSLYAVYFISQNPTVLSFENGLDMGLSSILRLPFAYNGSSLNLGEIDITKDKAYATNNPSLILDFDYDGVKDFEDHDDQNNGILDTEEYYKTTQVGLCHFDEIHKNGNYIFISLADIFEHLAHGDSLGDCRY